MPDETAIAADITKPRIDYGGRADVHEDWFSSAIVVTDRHGNSIRVPSDAKGNKARLRLFIHNAIQIFEEHLNECHEKRRCDKYDPKDWSYVADCVKTLTESAVLAYEPVPEDMKKSNATTDPNTIHGVLGRIKNQIMATGGGKITFTKEQVEMQIANGFPQGDPKKFDVPEFTPEEIKMASKVVEVKKKK